MNEPAAEQPAQTRVESLTIDQTVSCVFVIGVQRNRQTENRRGTRYSRGSWYSCEYVVRARDMHVRMSLQSEQNALRCLRSEVRIETAAAIAIVCLRVATIVVNTVAAVRLICALCGLGLCVCK